MSRHLLYVRPDDCYIRYDADTVRLVAVVGLHEVHIPIGCIGLVELGQQLVKLGTAINDKHCAAENAIASEVNA